ncbi:hypothetical protein LCGC14_1299230, partial [marine sediment metagenome]
KSVVHAVADGKIIANQIIESFKKK